MKILMGKENVLQILSLTACEVGTENTISAIWKRTRKFFLPQEFQNDIAENDSIKLATFAIGELI